MHSVYHRLPCPTDAVSTASGPSDAGLVSDAFTASAVDVVSDTDPASDAELLPDWVLISCWLVRVQAVPVQSSNILDDVISSVDGDGTTLVDCSGGIPDGGISSVPLYSVVLSVV